MVKILSGYENTFMAICQKCEKTFDTNFTVINSVNIDFKGYQSEKLLDNNINRIICPYCNCNFTYERPFVAYSVKQRFAVLADFNFKGENFYFGRKNLFMLFKLNDMKFRIVNYMCEVSEKYRIFCNNLDDYKIEYIKYKFFDDKYFNDKTNKILLFDKLEDNNIILNLHSDSDDILDTYKIPYKEYEEANIQFNPSYYHNDQCIWYNINTNYIKEHINE